MAATLAAWVPPIVFGLRWPDYRASRDFISELGATGAPDASAVNVSFLAAGLLFMAACVLIARRKGGGRAMAALSLVSLVGVSYIVAAVVPCDAGCPSEGSATQMLHNGVGGLGYLAAAIGLFLAAGAPFPAPSGPRWLAAASGAIALASLMGMGAPELSGVRGAVQRLGEAGIFTWLLVEAAAVNRTRPRST
jgi:hypothetical protein